MEEDVEDEEEEDEEEGGEGGEGGEGEEIGSDDGCSISLANVCCNNEGIGPLCRYCEH